jgi:uncharacterized membrane protein YccC
LVALAVAQTLDVHHPWWAAMTVWLVAQPTRGLLLERSLARLAGTACGALTGALILYGLEGLPLLSLAALVSWLALCAGVGSMFRHFRNYGFVLAGYTAAIVVLFAIGDGTYSPGVALDRVTCTIIGMFCSTLASLRGVPSGSIRASKERVDDILRRCLDRVEAYLREGRARASADPLASDIGALNRAVDEDAGGSWSRHRHALRVRRVSGLLLELIAQTLGSNTPSRAAPIEHRGSPEQRILELTALASSGGQPGLSAVLDELLEELRRPGTALLGSLRRDFDTASALRAALRPVIAVAIAIAIWRSTSWQAGNMMTMTAALFATLFSSQDQANQMLGQVLIGSLIGAVAGGFARLFVLPSTHGLLSVLLCVAPVLFIGAWLIRSRTVKIGIDLNMTFLLTAQPTSPPAGADLVLSQAVAILAGVLAVAATYWLVLPATPQLRVRELARRISRLILRIGQSRSTLAAANAQRSLGEAQVRLLNYVDPTSALFLAAQNCLAEGRRAVVLGCQSERSDHPLPPTAIEDALRRASAALNACLEQDRERQAFDVRP